MSHDLSRSAGPSRIFTRNWPWNLQIAAVRVSLRVWSAIQTQTIACLRRQFAEGFLYITYTIGQVGSSFEVQTAQTRAAKEERQHWCLSPFTLLVSLQCLCFLYSAAF
ncbi:unnamed protein product [Ixodes persulcatus]